MTDFLENEKRKGQVANCEKCHKEFWTKWHVDHKEIKVCGPCYFKTIKNER